LENGARDQSMQISALGDRLQSLTGHSWNKKFKKTYGSLQDFLKSQKKLFVVKDDVISLKAEPVATDMPKPKVNKRVATKPKRVPEPAPQSTKETISDENEKDCMQTCIHLVSVIILVLVVAIAVLCFLDGQTPQVIFQKISSFNVRALFNRN